MGRYSGQLTALFTAGSLVLAGCSSQAPVRSVNSADRYADYPLSFGCEIDGSGGGSDPVGPIVVTDVSVDHLSGDRISVTLTFPGPVPEYTSTDRAGSLVYGVLLKNSPTAGGYISIGGLDGIWQANDVSLGDTGDDPLESVDLPRYNQLKLNLDLSHQQEFLGSGEFEPVVVLDSGVRTGLQNGLGTADLEVFHQQVCSADSQPSAGRPTPTTSTRVPRTTPRETPKTTERPTTPPNRGTSPMKWVFQSPSGNIACTLAEANGKAQASCEVKENEYASYPTSGCSPNAPIVFSLSEGKPARVQCNPRSAYPAGLPVQGYGRPISVGTISCTLSESTGVGCKDQSTGRFFQASREAAKWG